MTSSRDPTYWSALVERSIAGAVEFLVNCQQTDGGFPVTCWNRDSTSDPEDRLFGTACILLAVGEVLPSTCLRAALTLLQHRRNSTGFWHFDAAGDLPADADDTACALAALLRFAAAPERPTFPDVERLAAFVRPNGRIATWLTPASLTNPDTDDVVVVANVIYAMALWNVSYARHHLMRWLELSAPNADANPGLDNTRNAAPGSSSNVALLAMPYYIYVETVGYAWARTLRALDIPRPTFPVTNAISRSPLCCALAASAADAPYDDLISFLLRSQHPSGYWEEEPWFQSPGANFGSAALTTAFAVEALNQLLKEPNDAVTGGSYH